MPCGARIGTCIETCIRPPGAICIFPPGAVCICIWPPGAICAAGI
eukprot:CAMPEP_0195090196 /NCGR_PEP_ID=MMETSP0448-20130528/29261_1 /TAXON_ID=66468 /ORGANISM="Heterocapsa triquestra, Strain CCMP 448" /LENGTH=44 /DNA_ID= /DNA_START= /DNA_END= /DNA_ORIENTATION=